MAFEKYTNYNPDVGVNQVIASAGKPLLEVELNEIQLIQNEQNKRLIANFFGDGISDITKITFNQGVLSIDAGCYITCNGNIIKCTGLSIDLAEGETAYLLVWEEIITYNDELIQMINVICICGASLINKMQKAGG
mgnify:CR=1 FL=1